MDDRKSGRVMKIVILAAGKGSRLGKPGWPKPLTDLANGQTILGYQLEAISQYTSLRDVLVVVGFKKEKIMDAYPDLLYVYNPKFASENTAKSLLRALSKVAPGEDVIWINGDVVFHPAVFGAALAAERSAMVVNCGSVGAEEVKYHTDAEGRILEVSKHVMHPQGEAIGLNVFKGEDVDVLRYELQNNCTDKDYFEKGIESCIETGLEVWAAPVERNLCTEIDFPEDLERANELIKKWEST